MNAFIIKEISPIIQSCVIIFHSSTMVVKQLHHELYLLNLTRIRRSRQHSF